MRPLLAAIALLLASLQGAAAASTETLGTDVAIALPVIAGGITLYKVVDGKWTTLQSVGGK